MENITFRQFINAFNFRYLRDNGNCNNYPEDTMIIRVHLFNDQDIYNHNDWFEFGVYSFDNCKTQRIEKIFSKEILESYVETISYVYDNPEEIEIYLTKDKESD